MENLSVEARPGPAPSELTPSEEVVSTPHPYQASPTPPPLTHLSPAPPRRFEPLWLAGVVLLLALAGVGFALVRGLSPAPPQAPSLTAQPQAPVNWPAAVQWILHTVVPETDQLGEARVESVQLVDPLQGPLMVVVISPHGQRWAYEMVLTQQENAWFITGRRLGAIIPTG